MTNKSSQTPTGDTVLREDQHRILASFLRIARNHKTDMEMLPLLKDLETFFQGQQTVLVQRMLDSLPELWDTENEAEEMNLDNISEVERYQKHRGHNEAIDQVRAALTDILGEIYATMR